MRTPYASTATCNRLIQFHTPTCIAATRYNRLRRPFCEELRYRRHRAYKHLAWLAVYATVGYWWFLPNVVDVFQAVYAMSK